MTFPVHQRSLRPPAGGRWRCDARGFTLVELVVVMLLMALLASLGAARFASREPFAVQSAADQVMAGLRLAQATAVAQRRTIHVQLGATPAQLSVCLDSGCASPLPSPDGDANWLVDAGDLVLSTGASFNFSASGTPSLAGNLSLQVRSADGSASSQTLVVEAGSGHVHMP